MATLKDQLIDLLEDTDQEHESLVNLINQHDTELKEQRAFIEQLSKQLNELQNLLSQR